MESINNEFKSIIEALKTETDPQKREELNQRLEKLVNTITSVDDFTGLP